MMETVAILTREILTYLIIMFQEMLKVPELLKNLMIRYFPWCKELQNGCSGQWMWLHIREIPSTALF